MTITETDLTSKVTADFPAFIRFMREKSPGMTAKETHGGYVLRDSSGAEIGRLSIDARTGMKEYDGIIPGAKPVRITERISGKFPEKAAALYAAHDPSARDTQGAGGVRLCYTSSKSRADGWSSIPFP